MSTVQVRIPLPADLFEDAERLRSDEQRSPVEFYGEAIRRYLELEQRHRTDRQGAAEFQRALGAAAGVWEDHPAFSESEDVRSWRTRLWAPDQSLLERPAE